MFQKLTHNKYFIISGTKKTKNRIKFRVGFWQVFFRWVYPPPPQKKPADLSSQTSVENILLLKSHSSTHKKEENPEPA